MAKLYRLIKQYCVIKRGFVDFQQDSITQDYTPELLTPRVLQVSDSIGLYGAELARILHLQCKDISAMVAVRKKLDPDEKAWDLAIQLIELYKNLYRLKQGNDVAIYHWLRRNNSSLKGIPLLLIIDNNKLTQVEEYIRKELFTSQNKLYVNEPF